MIDKKISRLELHESLELSATLTITKVIDGWIYTCKDEATGTSINAILVPRKENTTAQLGGIMSIFKNIKI